LLCRIMIICRGHFIRIEWVWVDLGIDSEYAEKYLHEFLVLLV
jgi:hypothetical protein